MLHPADIELELVHLGQPDPEVSRHVTGCERCQHFVQMLDEAREETGRRQSPEAYAIWLRGHRSQRQARRPALLEWMGFEWLRSQWLRGALGGLALAASALVAVTVLREDEAAPATAEVLVPRGGGSGLSVVRVRGGELQVFREVVPVTPADTIGLRFSLARPGRVTAGILTDAGEWATFFDEKEFPAGLNMPDLTLQVNDDPGSGRLLLGPPAQVEAARLGKPAPDVQSALIVWSRGR